MAHRWYLGQYYLRIALATACISLAAEATAREVLIRIVGSGGSAEYLEDGASLEEPVEVVVGDTVVWRNEGNRTHTATAENDDGELLFDTRDIPRATNGNFETSNPIEMTAELFEKAGGQPGMAIGIEYFCDHHSEMESSLVLREASDDAHDQRSDRRPPREPDRERRERGRASLGGSDEEGVRLRRDIATLTTVDLNDYRDAWRRIQQNGDYADVAGYHGCPDQFCHRPSEQITFLAWHREYLLRIEEALGQPLHYWDWTSPAAAKSGIPAAFTEPTYVARDGNTYPNPLLSYRFTCPPTSPARTTIRFPRSPSFLEDYAGQVRDAYSSRTYRDVNLTLESPPHDNLHGWVGGTMGGVFHAAYDPIFWAHHANVDRQWASWQRDGGADPTSTETGQSLRGFPGRTIGDVVDIAELGYEYDRYDRTRDSVTPFAALGAGQGEDVRGVGKTFNVRRGELTAAGAAKGPLALYVSGIPEHPRDSYFVYVFVNQPDATPEDATRDNPNFAGTFAVFGMGGPAQRDGEEEHPVDGRDRPEAKRVLELFGGNVAQATETINTVTLVTTDETGVLVGREDVPFKSISLRAARAAEGGREGEEGRRGAANERRLLRGAREFSGVSGTGSYDDAYQDAIDQAKDAFGNAGADRIIDTEVISVTGEHGGVAGVNRLKVTIRAQVR